MCSNTSAKVRLDGWDLVITAQCPSCGVFLVGQYDVDDFLETPEKKDKHEAWKISCLSKQHSVRNRRPLFLIFNDRQYSPDYEKYCDIIQVRELLHRWPHLVSARINEALCNLAYLSSEAGQTIRNENLTPPLFFSRNTQEAEFIRNALFSRGAVEATIDGMYANGIRVTAKGWEIVEENLRTRDPVRKPPFVAMWFGGEEPTYKAQMTALFTDAIATAVGEAGYLKPVRIDHMPHNEWIVDQIMAMIKEAPFVIADLTNHNPGVYWEAGFARGLGIPVVHCCPEEEGKQTHFDLQQMNQVRYKTPAELRERLRDRIRGSIGKGPFEMA